MRIQNNIMAMNAYRNYTSNTSALSKNLEKLSSGYKINRAGDDAAGLAISEKMRAQITGLDVAQKNAKDGISLVQTAEGALTEVHDMLNRMVELADQSANGTYDAKDREQLQKEVSELKDEIDRIADSTNFNGINLLDGSLGSGTTGVKAASTANTGGTAGNFKAAVNFEISGLEAGKTVTIKTVNGDSGADGISVDSNGNVTLSLKAEAGRTITQADIDDIIKNATLPESAKGLSIKIDKNIEIETKGTGDVVQVNAAEVKDATNATAKDNGKLTNVDGGKANLVFTADKAGVNTSTITISNTDTTAEGAVTGTNGDVALNLDADKEYTAAEINALLREGNAGVTVSFDGAIKGSAFLTGGSGNDATYQLGNDGTAGAGLASGGGLTLQIGDTADSYNQLEVSVKDMHVASMGLSGIDISTQAGAKAAVEVIKEAINYVSDVRGTLGATQNRLDHTINNLAVMQENIQDAESTIRDTDVAEEMMSYTKNNILIQSAQAMLAQANQVPQGVLQLLQ
ncbi:flagellin [Angelakisella massiliensis]|uniref:flagellin N-terminal helical domain-containing protein n=1 Tax=Angelakisella massiliensis TaxID=1871018 RepID=UPI0008F9291E|nr:flagellin [Angelakisella massiliensis]